MAHTSLSENPPHAYSRNLGLDVMRAIAILLVLVSHWSNNILYWFGIHAPWRVFFAGDLGVELFFSLSGFLIGRILIEQVSSDSSWQNLRIFLVRRWMRTLPLYFLMLAVLLLAFPPQEGALTNAIEFATMTQNLAKPMPPGWWYAVTWSLAIEEWFYVLFGCAVFLSFRMIRAPWMIWVPIAVFLTIPLALRLAVPGFSDPSLGMSKTVLFRLDEIAYGVVMAKLYVCRARVFRHPFICLSMGLALIASAWSGHMPVPHDLAPALVYNVTIIGCALLLPAAVSLTSMPAAISKIVRAISAQSYGLYLIHLTILVDVAQGLWWRHLLPTWGCVVVAVVAPFVLSYLSLRYIEAPIMRMRPKHGSLSGENARTDASVA